MNSFLNKKHLAFGIAIVAFVMVLGMHADANACWANCAKIAADKAAAKEARIEASLAAHPNVFYDYARNAIINSFGGNVAAAKDSLAFFNSLTVSQIYTGVTIQTPVVYGVSGQIIGYSCNNNITACNFSYNASGQYYGYNWNLNNGLNFLCQGWGCLLGDLKGNGKGNNPGVVVLPPDFTPPPGWTPPPNWTPPFTPLPSNQPVISEFKITNFTQRTDASSGVPFYFILSPQMQAGYKANIAWSVSGATSCTASCVYKDENGTQLPDQPGQANDCQWWGTVDPNSGNQGVQPKWQGTVQYTLTCQNGTLSDSKTFNAAIRQFSWQEVLGNQIAKFAALFR